MSRRRLDPRLTADPRLKITPTFVTNSDENLVLPNQPEHDKKPLDEILDHLAESDPHAKDDDLSDMLDDAPTTSPHMPEGD